MHFAGTSPAVLVSLPDALVLPESVFDLPVHDSLILASSG